MDHLQAMNSCGTSPRCASAPSLGIHSTRLTVPKAFKTVRVNSAQINTFTQTDPSSLASKTRKSRCRLLTTKCDSTFNSTAVTLPSFLAPHLPSIIAVGALALLVAVLKKVYDTPSRTYSGNVGDEYDAWATEGILEYYWGEHIHLGYYTDEERRKGYKKKDFKQAKYDFIDEMLKWTGVQKPKKILDVGCGIGGTSRYLAARFPDAEIIGITLSPQQVERGTQLAAAKGLTNCKFMVMDALAMTFEPNSFDLVWACESGEHMPDKKKYVEQMSKVLAPEGVMAIATWCQREETPSTPFTQKDKSDLQFLYDEWAHPFFISYEDYARMLQGTGVFQSVTGEDWTEPTLPSWRHSNWVGVWDPWPVVFKWNPWVWYKVTREIVTIERFHRAFARGLMTYGMIKGTKKSMEELKKMEGAQQLTLA